MSEEKTLLVMVFWAWERGTPHHGPPPCQKPSSMIRVTFIYALGMKYF
jgi:hypothetical protein